MAITKEFLQNFEANIAQLFLDKKILAPIHLSDGNENVLIDIFKGIRPQDWVFCSWRSHYHALLKGIPPEQLKKDILDGRSMFINSQEHKFFSSAIAGGICPIAVGVAMGIKRQNNKDKVYCFVGDMTAEMGIFHECAKYAFNFDLPIIFYIEDNGVSVGTPTKVAWGKTGLTNYGYERIDSDETHEAFRYRYKKEKWPHVGCGTIVIF